MCRHICFHRSMRTLFFSQREAVNQSEAKASQSLVVFSPKSGALAVIIVDWCRTAWCFQGRKLIFLLSAVFHCHRGYWLTSSKEESSHPACDVSSLLTDFPVWWNKQPLKRGVTVGAYACYPAVCQIALCSSCQTSRSASRSNFL